MNAVKLPHRCYHLWSHDPSDPIDFRCLPVEYGAANTLPDLGITGKPEEIIDDHIKMIGPTTFDYDHYYLVLKANKVFVSCLN